MVEPTPRTRLGCVKTAPLPSSASSPVPIDLQTCFYLVISTTALADASSTAPLRSVLGSNFRGERWKKRGGGGDRLASCKLGIIRTTDGPSAKWCRSWVVALVGHWWFLQGHHRLWDGPESVLCVQRYGYDVKNILPGTI